MLRALAGRFARGSALGHAASPKARHRLLRRSDVSLLRAVAAVADPVAALERRVLLSSAEASPYLPPQHFLFAADTTLAGPAVGPARQIALNFISAHAQDLGLAASDIGDPAITDQYTDSDTGVTHIYLRQRVGGIEVANSNLNVNLLSNGSVLSVGGGFMALSASTTVQAAAANTMLSSGQALAYAAVYLGLGAAGSGTVSVASASGDNNTSQVLSLDPINPKIQYVATPEGLKLGWQFILRTPDGNHWYDTTADAYTGAELQTYDWVDSATYNVYPIPVETPADGSRALVVDPANPTASPFSWHDTNGVAGAEFTDTRGNNVFAQEDADANNTGGVRPDGGAGLVFDNPLDLSQAPSAYRSAATTNLFYWVNLNHDIHYMYGFNEVTGNFQQMNYSGQGLGNDAVQADAQDGAGTNNANFSSPPDGSPGRMQMYIFTSPNPDRDGDLESMIITHEYGHGVSNRLTGGPANANALSAVQSAGMGEGWSDWWGLMFTQKPTDTKTASYPVGTYVSNGTAGIRRYPYAYNMTVDPLTISNYNSDSSHEVHNTGEIWCTVLWDLNWLLIDKYGYSSNISQGYDPNVAGKNGGNNLALQLVMDALKLQPANPSFLQARDAILQADQVRTGGANKLPIWTAFARRGMGASFIDSSSSATSLTAAFDLPAGVLKPKVASSSPAGIVSSAPSFVDFTFSKSMNPTSFSVADDVSSFLSPTGTNLKGQISGASWLNSNTTLRLSFPTLSTQGSYQMTIGPDIRAADDDSQMDQNGDGTAGQAGVDQYTVSFLYDATVQTNVIYVDAAATGLGTGSSWANAYNSLSAALTAAASGKEIHVADGTYKPTTGTDRTATFQLKNGVTILGGYAGFGAANPDARDVVQFASILSGDIGVSGSSADNSYRVVTGSGTNSTAILDGFTITAGNANSNSTTGGGLYNSSGSPTISNCIFLRNNAINGGAVYNSSSSPKFTNCIFAGNTASYGGAMDNSNTSAPTLINCVMVGNMASNDGGGIYNETSGCPTVINCTVVANVAGGEGGGMRGVEPAPTVKNSVIWDNSATWGSQISSVPHIVTYSDLEGGYPGAGNIAADPLFIRNPSPGADGVWGTPDDDYGDLRLSPDSPAVDAANNSSVPAGVGTDIGGAIRFQDVPTTPDSGAGSKPIVDMGAYEATPALAAHTGGPYFVAAGQSIQLAGRGASSTAGALKYEWEWSGDALFDDATGANPVFSSAGLPINTVLNVSLRITDAGSQSVISASTLLNIVPALIYVDGNAIAGARNGTSWTDAFTDLNAALAIAQPAQQVRVADGTYKPTSTADRTATFRVKSGVAVLGGYAGGGAADPDSRDSAAFPTILSGDIGAIGTSSDNSYHVVTTSLADSLALVDGFTITGGNANGAALVDSSGGGLINFGGSPTISNCIFTGNFAAWGGGLASTDGIATISNCVFLRNSATQGGGIYTNVVPSPLIIGCRVIGNTASTGGGGVWFDSSSTTVVNSVIAGNAGGAVRIRWDAFPAFVNCTITANTVSGVVNEFTSKPTFVNSILWNNAGAQSNNGSIISYSNVQNGFTGTGNINVDPLFKRNPSAGTDGAWGTADDDYGDLRLQTTSPSVDAGNNAAVPGGISTDFAGGPRFLDVPFKADTGLGVAPVVDMGAYEAAAVVSADAGGPYFVRFGQTTALHGSGTGSVAGALQFAWEWSGDGAFDDGAGTDPVFNAAGIPLGTTLTVSLRVTDAGSKTAVASTTLLVVSGVIYVDLNASGSNNGTSWANAYTSLAAALSTALPAQEIHVADGTYKPTTSTDRTATFTLKSNVAVLGGYAGIGAVNPDVRDPALFPTILSGDIGTIGSNTDNAFHIVTASGVNSLAVLDGFTITAGNASGSSANNVGAGIYNVGGSPTISNCFFTANSAAFAGAGIYNSAGAAPAISNCRFTANSANLAGTTDGGGAGIYNTAASPTILSCSFIANKGGYRGGAVVNLASSPAIITNCQFLGNSISGSGASGGALRNSSSNAKITNCTFVGNIASSLGGAIDNTSSSPVFTNCTFVANSAGSGGGAINNSGSTISEFDNCILWNNGASSQISGNATTIIYSDVQGGFTGTGNLYVDPQFTRDPASGADATWGTGDDDYGDLTPRLTSPVIDAGNNFIVPAGVTTDLAGAPRFVDVFSQTDTGRDTAPIVDMGAYEASPAVSASAGGPYFAPLGSAVPLHATGTASVPGPLQFAWEWTGDGAFDDAAGPDPVFNAAGIAPGASLSVSLRVTDAASRTAVASTTLLVSSGIIYVDGFATGLNNGTSWTNAYNSLAQALSTAVSGQEIHVADGTYKPTVSNDRTGTFRLKSGVSLYGGFAGAGADNPDLRDLAIFPSILSGDIGAAGTTVDNCYHVVTAGGVNSLSVLDGFTITAGNAAGSSPNDVGAGIFNVGGSPTITNCIIRNNTATFGGAGIYNSALAAPAIVNCTFTKNAANSAGTSAGGGGGMYNTGSSPIVLNCTFLANTAGYDGAGMTNIANANPTITNCLFLGNSQSSWGPALSNEQSSPVVTNCIFVGNVATQSGGAINNASSSPIFTNCTFVANSAPSGGAINNSAFNGPNAAPMFTNCILWNNSPAGSLIVGNGSIITYSDIQAGLAGTGNLNADPKFMRYPSPGADGAWGTADDDYGDLRLRLNSPMIDAGNSNALAANITVDLGSAARFDDVAIIPDSGVGVRPIVDIGAYEVSSLLTSTAARIVNSSIQEGDLRGAGALNLSFAFSKPMRAANLDTGDFSLKGNLLNVFYTPTVFAYAEGNTVLNFSYANLPEDQYTLTLLSDTGRFADAQGDDLDGEPNFPIPPNASGNGVPGGNFAVTFSLDKLVSPFPTPFTQQGPGGSRVYARTVNSVIGVAGDVDSFTLNLDPGQILTLVASPISTTLRPRISLFSPEGSLIGATTAAAANQKAVILTIPINLAGEYSISLTGESDTIGAYSIQAVLNATVEAEDNNGPANDTIATAQALDTASISLGAGPWLASVMGRTTSLTGPDYYSLFLPKGHVAFVALNSSAGASPATSLYDAAGNLLVNGVQGINLNRYIARFTAPSSGAYFVRVTGTSLTYTLTVCQDTVFDLENNNVIADSQLMNVNSVATGELTASTDFDYYKFFLSAGQSIRLSTYTLGDGPGEFVNSLNPRLNLYLYLGSPQATLVAANDDGAADGRNALLTYTAPADGIYAAQISTGVTRGEYVLRFENALGIDLPPDVAEGGGSAIGTLNTTTISSNDLIVALSSSNSQRLSVPATVTIPAGQQTVSFPLTVLDNDLLDGPEAINLTASATGYTYAFGTVTVHDNEAAALTLTLPASATEGDAPLSGTVTSSLPPTRDIAIQLSSDKTSKLTVPATVTLKAGQTSASFLATVVDNTVIDGTLSAKVTASTESWTSGSATVAVADNDVFITVSLPAGGGWEGQTLTNAGTITIGGTLSTALTIQLTSLTPAALTVPASVTIPAGSTTAAFNLTLVSDGAKAGNRTASMTASATGFTSGTNSLIVHDSALDRLAFDPITSPKTAGVGFSATARAFNSANEVIVNYASTGTLSAAGQGGQGGSLPVTPASLTFSAGVGTATLTITALDPAAVVTLVSGGLSVSSNSFALQAGTVASLQWSTISSPQSVLVPFAASIVAKDANGFTANFNGNVALSGLSGPGSVSQAIAGDVTYTNSLNNGTFTLGYAFTPNTSFPISHVRSFFGSKVTIWSNTGTLLATQTVSGPAATWTETPLATPLTLTAGTTYRIAVYTAGLLYYWRTTRPPSPSFGTLGQSYTRSSDGFPNTVASGTDWFLVDLRGNAGSVTSVPISPSTATFVNGNWTGNISVSAAATSGMLLRADDGAGHVASSNTFNVLLRNLSLAAPADGSEGAGPYTATVSTNVASASDTVVTLSSSNTGRISVPPSVTIPAGQTSASFNFAVVDNTFLDGPQSVNITASAAGFTDASATVNVHDNETAVLTVNLPATAKEGDPPLAGSVVSSLAPTRDLTLQLSSDKTSKLTVPATITLKAGQTTASFAATLLNNSILDGAMNAKVTASMENWTSGSATVGIADDEAFITISLPAGGWEGQTLTNAGTVAIGGASTTPVTINLTSLNPTALALPPNVTIPAGSTSATFSFTLLDDALKAGNRTAAMTAAAAGLTGGNASLLVHDGSLDHLMFDPITTSRPAGAAFPVVARAFNIANEAIVTYSSAGTLTAAGQAGGALPITPTAINFAAGVAAANITIRAADPAAAITIVSGGVSAVSNSFALQPGPLAAFQWGTIPAVGQTVPFPATLSARDANGIEVNVSSSVAISGYIPTSTLVISEVSPNAFIEFVNAFITPLNIGGWQVYLYDLTGNPQPVWTFPAGITVPVGGVITLQKNGTSPGAYPTFFTGREIQMAGARTAVLLRDSGGNIVDFMCANSTTAASITNPTIIPSSQWTGNQVTNSGTSYHRIGTQDLNNNTDWTSGAATPGVAHSALTLPFLSGVQQFSIQPASVTLTNGRWSGNLTISSLASNLFLRAADSSGHIGFSNSFDVIANPAPQAPDLTAASDTGASSSDNITRRNNSSSARVLQFTVGGTPVGSTVTLYADGQLIGSAVATSLTTTMLTDGLTALSEGPHLFTAREKPAGGTVSTASPGLTVSIDATAPVVAVTSSTSENPSPALEGTIDDPAASVQTTVGDNTYPATSVGAGKWTLAAGTISPPLAVGTYDITVTATDIAGNSAVDITVNELTIVPAPTPLPPIYVDANAPGAGDGAAWATAYRNLADALAAAAAGQEIRVADGTYRPSSSNRAASFLIPTAVAVYGGYAGYGASVPDDRDSARYPAILSGDIGAAGIAADNSFHVVRTSGAAPSTILDGFTITGGNASGTGNDGSGGGVWNTGGSPAIRNCIFQGNLAAGGGGAMFNSAASPLVINCVFVGNAAPVGGGILNAASSTPQLVNCTLVENLGGAAFDSDSASTITNSILWSSASPSGQWAGANSINAGVPIPQPAVTYCIAAGIPGAGNLAVQPLFLRDPNAGADNDWGTADDDYGDLRLRPHSPGVDAGLNSAVPVWNTLDAAGKARIIDIPLANGSGPAVDLGAYETTLTVFNKGTAGDDQFYLRLSSDRTELQIWPGASPTGAPLNSYPIASLGLLEVVVGAGDDTIWLDMTNGLPPSGMLSLSCSGGLDTLMLVGSSAADSVDMQALKVTINSSIISLFGLDLLKFAAPPAGLLQLTSLSASGAVALPDTASLFQVSALSIDSGGQLDLTGSSLDLLNAAPSDVQRIQQMIVDGRLVSGGPQALSFTRTPVALDNRRMHLRRFAGLPINNGVDFNQVIVTRAYLGDANLDGQVNQSDYVNIFAKLGRSGDWLDGDMNHDGLVTLDDLALVTANLGAGAGPGVWLLGDGAPASPAKSAQAAGRAPAPLDSSANKSKKKKAHGKHGEHDTYDPHGPGSHPASRRARG